MVRIPDAVNAVMGAHTDPRELRQIIITIVLRYQELQGEDEPLVITEEDLRRARDYVLQVRDMEEEGAIVLTARLR